MEREAPTQTDIAWAAGLFDGEGSIGIYWHTAPSHRGGRSWQLRATLGIVHQETAERFHEIVELGVLRLESHRARPVKPIWYWQTHAAQAEQVLRLLLPFLVCKREQANAALEFRSTFGSDNRGRVLDDDTRDKRQELATKVRQLKLSG